ncbi:EF-hand domain-containing protein [Oleiharenicola lentus]|uniref:EF-hand domain-containing protein n=1 Tax=Oleiharenicola lentus TaxID=2508720 RepID=UPI003F661BA0
MKTPLALMCGLALGSVSAFAGGHDPDDKFKMMDTNSDGMISRSEHTAGAQTMFSKLDTNMDGNVTSAEMDAAWAGEGKKADKKEMSASQKIAAIDSNGDGQLSQSEHVAGSEAMFTAADKDADGSLSKDEFKDAHKQMKKDKKW